MPHSPRESGAGSTAWPAAPPQPSSSAAAIASCSASRLLDRIASGAPSAAGERGAGPAHHRAARCAPPRLNQWSVC